MNIGTRVYYTGDVCNQPSEGTIVEILPPDRWTDREYYVVQYDNEGRRETYMASAFEGPGAGRRHWFLDEWKLDQATKAAAGQRAIEAEIAKKYPPPITLEMIGEHYGDCQTLTVSFPDALVEIVDGNGTALTPATKGLTVTLYMERDLRTPHTAELDSGSHHAEIGLTFDDSVLIDFDGVFFLPKEVGDLLAAIGFTVPTDCLP